MNFKRSRILSVGTVVPDKVFTNFDFEKFLDTSDEWIVQRTGIRTRHISPEHAPDPAADLGSRAVKVALDRAGVAASEVDCLVCATFTPDNFFPSTACGISNRVGCANAFAFDLSAACSGFIYGITVANSLIVSGQCKTVIVVGAEVISKALDWTDRSTCILFGDGAGAVVMQGSDDDDAGMLLSIVKTDSTLGDILKLPAWDGRQKMTMNGNEVYKQAVRQMADTTQLCLDRCGLTIEQLDLLIPHQANIRIMTVVAKHLNCPLEKVISNVDEYGNTSSASIPLALEKAWTCGRIKTGTLVAFTALGGGITYGSALVRF
jgi:3-oxoacyl-[acyl-carrier-protein] synthase-3